MKGDASCLIIFRGIFLKNSFFSIECIFIFNEATIVDVLLITSSSSNVNSITMFYKKKGYLKKGAAQVPDQVILADQVNFAAPAQPHK